MRYWANKQTLIKKSCAFRGHSFFLVVYQQVSLELVCVSILFRQLSVFVQPFDQAVGEAAAIVLNFHEQPFLIGQLVQAAVELGFDLGSADFDFGLGYSNIGQLRGGQNPLFLRYALQNE